MLQSVDMNFSSAVKYSTCRCNWTAFTGREFQ